MEHETIKIKQLTFLNALNKLGKRIFCFSGRSSRSEYWLGYLGLLIISTSMLMIMSILWLGLTLLAIMTGLAGGDAFAGDGTPMYPLPPFLSVIAAICMIIVIFVMIIALALDTRRLHDIGLSGWWCILSFLPFGSLVLFILFLRPSKPDNKYGLQPEETL